jgi:AraC-like DNA-binding protein
MLSYNMLVGFFRNMDIQTLPVATQVKEVDRRHLAKAEGMVIAGLSSAFPGIEPIAKAVHMSPTKLKALFKEVYGNTLFGYYQEKQMLLALEMLRQKAAAKDVALSLGYENASNFTLAFKKYHGFLPSEVADHPQQ